MKIVFSIVTICCAIQLHSQCLQSKNKYSNNIESNSGTNLSVTTENTIKSEFNLLKSFFNVSIDLAILDFELGPCYIPDLKILIADKKELHKVSKLSYGNERVKAILAHEFAHALQDKAGLYNIWTGGKKVELHADFLAGYYIGQKGLISKEKLKTFAQEFFDKGDFAFYEEDHHGTPEERRCAFLEGYKVAIDYKFNINQAYNCGVDYIKLLYPCDYFGIIREYSKTECNNNNYTLPTGGYKFSSSQQVMGFYNLYYQPLAYAAPGTDAIFNNLTPGTYVVIPGKVKKSGKVKFYPPFSFTVKPNHTGGFTINKVGVFAIRTYSITY